MAKDKTTSDAWMQEKAQDAIAPSYPSKSHREMRVKGCLCSFIIDEPSSLAEIACKPGKEPFTHSSVKLTRLRQVETLYYAGGDSVPYTGSSEFCS